MSRPKFSIAGSLAFVMAVAIGLAAISRPSCLWASAAFSGFIFLLAIALIKALCHRQQKRAFWAGFFACGSLYAVLSLAPWFDGHVSPRLITTAILDLLYPHIPRLPSGGNASDPWEHWNGAPADYSLAHPRAGFSVNTTDEFLLIGHSLFGQLIACGGGFFTYVHLCQSPMPKDDQGGVANL